MAISGVAPLKQAFVQYLRADTTLRAAVTGIHEGQAPRGATMPFLTYHIAWAPYEHNWDGGAVQKVGIDVFVVAENGVDAGNIDALVLTRLHNAGLSVTGQTTLICRRLADVVVPPYVSEEGKRIHQAGGTYEVWTDQ